MNLYDVNVRADVDFTFPVIAEDEEDLGEIVKELIGKRENGPDPELVKAAEMLRSFISEHFYNGEPTDSDEIQMKISPTIVGATEIDDECEPEDSYDAEDQDDGYPETTGLDNSDGERVIFCVNPNNTVRTAAQSELDRVRTFYGRNAVFMRIPGTKCLLMYSRFQTIPYKEHELLLGNAYVMSDADSADGSDAADPDKAVDALFEMARIWHRSMTDGTHVFNAFEIK